MNLNEAYRYSNYLSGLIDTVRMALMDDKYIKRTTVEHHYSEAGLPGLSDQTEDQINRGPLDFAQPDDLIDFLMVLVTEKQDVTYAIDNAKPKRGDAEVGLNKVRREVGVLLSNMGSNREKEVIETVGTGYTSDKEGHQTTFNYPMEYKRVIAYDRDRAKQLGRDLIRKADLISSQLDLDRVSTEVNFHPLFEVTDTCEDAYHYVESHLYGDAATE